jgi:hypothetical protein
VTLSYAGAMLRRSLALVAGLVLAGCGSDDESETPVACLADADAYLTALENAPDDVRLDGTTPISECIVDGQDGGELAQVGEPLVAAATELNRRAQEDPGGEGTVQLGYLVGTVQEAASTTGGIHQDLVIRLDAAARFSGPDGPFPASFERAFGAGYAAGQASG